MNNIDQYKNRFNQLMESKNGDVKPLLSEMEGSESEIEEGGGTWEGIKGFFRGKGYYYTKYLTQIQNLLEKLKKKIIDDKKIKSDLDEILEDVSESSMSEAKKEQILNILVDIAKSIEIANKSLEAKIEKIKSLKG